MLTLTLAEASRPSLLPHDGLPHRRADLVRRKVHARARAQSRRINRRVQGGPGAWHEGDRVHCMSPAAIQDLLPSLTADDRPRSMSPSGWRRNADECPCAGALIAKPLSVVSWPSAAPQESEETLASASTLGVKPAVTTFPSEKARQG